MDKAENNSDYGSLGDPDEIEICQLELKGSQEQDYIVDFESEEMERKLVIKEYKTKKEIRWKKRKHCNIFLFSNHFLVMFVEVRDESSGYAATYRNAQLFKFKLNDKKVKWKLIKEIGNIIFQYNIVIFKRFLSQKSQYF